MNDFFNYAEKITTRPAATARSAIKPPVDSETDSTKQQHYVPRPS